MKRKPIEQRVTDLERGQSINNHVVVKVCLSESGLASLVVAQTRADIHRQTAQQRSLSYCSSLAEFCHVSLPFLDTENPAQWPGLLVVKAYQAASDSVISTLQS